MSARKPLDKSKPRSVSTPRAKPSPRETDPLMDRVIRITAGEHAASKGIVRRAFRGRVATPDRVIVEIDGHRFVSIPTGAVEVLG